MSLTRTDAGLAAGAALRVTSSDRPQSLSGWSSDGRALLFTALGNQFYTTDISTPMDSLPRRIYYYATGPYDYWHEQAWAMSLVLVAIILVISLVVRTLFGSRVTVRQ